MERELRRFRDHLRISGMGIIVFGFWSVIRTTIYAITNRKELMSDVTESVDPELAATIYAITFAVILIFILIMRWFMGIRAIREAKGQKAGSMYILLAFLYVVTYIAVLALEIFDYKDMQISLIEEIVTVIVDLTSLSMFVELLYAVIQVRAMKKRN